MTEISRDETKYIKKACEKLLVSKYSFPVDYAVTSRNLDLASERMSQAYDGEDYSDVWSLIKDMRILNDTKNQKEMENGGDPQTRRIRNIYEQCSIKETVVGKTFRIILKLEGEFDE